MVKGRSDPVLDDVKQRFIVKYFFLMGWDSKRITAELQSTLHPSAISNSTVRRWIKRFETGDLCCDEDPPPGRPIEILGAF
jgi:transposase